MSTSHPDESHLVIVNLILSFTLRAAECDHIDEPIRQNLNKCNENQKEDEGVEDKYKQYW